MNWADYCIIIALVLSVLMGLWRGFIGEVIALACWVLAFWVAWTFGAQLAAQFTSITLPSARLLLGYAICFIGVLIVGALVGFLMRKLVATSGLSGSDRMLGMLFGLLRGLAIVTIARADPQVHAAAAGSVVEGIETAADVRKRRALAHHQAASGSHALP